MSNGYQNVGTTPTNSQLHEMYPESSLSMAEQQYKADYATEQQAISESNLPNSIQEDSAQPTADPSTLKEGSPQKTEVDNHTSAVVANTSTNVALDRQITTLQIKIATGTATDADKTSLSNLQAQLQVNQSSAPDPTTSSIKTPDASDVGTAMALQDFTVSTLAKEPAPQVNNVGEIRHMDTDPNNLIEYINATQFMNPWGRNRQCDEDLKALMAYVNQDINAELAAWAAVGKNIAQSSSD